MISKPPVTGQTSVWNTATFDASGNPRSRAELVHALKGVWVLVVDDDALARDACSRLFEDLGCEVIGAGNGRAAIEAIESNAHIQMVVLDYQMRDIDGFGIYSIIKDLNLDPSPKTIMVTGSADLSVRQTAEKLGIDCFLLKPLTAPVLLDAILGLMGS